MKKIKAREGGLGMGALALHAFLVLWLIESVFIFVWYLKSDMGGFGAHISFSFCFALLTLIEQRGYMLNLVTVRYNQEILKFSTLFKEKSYAINSLEKVKQTSANTVDVTVVGQNKSATFYGEAKGIRQLLDELKAKGKDVVVEDHKRETAFRSVDEHLLLGVIALLFSSHVVFLLMKMS